MLTTHTKKKAAKKKSAKNANKDIREPVGREANINKLSQKEKIRMATGKQMNLDASHYERMDEYQGMQLFWASTMDGEVEKWLNLDAILIPRKSKSTREFKGFTDQASSEWERVPVGSDGAAGTAYNYLMALPYEDYQMLRIQPKEDRNKKILGSLGMGKSQAEGAVMSNVKGLKTYAPNLPTGDGQGYGEVDLTHDV